MFLPQLLAVEWEHQSHSVQAGNCKVISCPSVRVRKAVEKLALGGFSFRCEIHAPSNEIAPDLESIYDYSLRVEKRTITLSAIEEWGALAGLATLQQMLWINTENVLRECVVHDSPWYKWRGLMVDVARHFIELKTLRETLDLMHYFKLNVLHLHLTDDQAFRFGSTSQPELVSDLHYTRSQLGELVEYAADRGIRVVPEIDMPGHTASWFLQHPEWVLGAFDASACTQFGPHTACLDPSNPELMSAVFNILAEVVETFVDPFVHVGGDEVNFGWWKNSVRVQKWARGQSLRTPEKILSAFFQPVFEWLDQRDKTPIVWDDSLHEDLPQNVVVQTWRGRNARDHALQAGHNTLISAPYYLDLNYPAHTHYRYRPGMPSAKWLETDTSRLQQPNLTYVKESIQKFEESISFPAIVHSHPGKVLGGEACMWSELVTDDLIHKRIWTRMPVIAEQFWCDKNVRSEADLNDIYHRLPIHLDALTRLGIPDLLATEEIHPCRELDPLFEMLEPVKWYTRHLTLVGLRARNEVGVPNDIPRPYDANTRLARVVDKLPVESMATHRCIRDVQQDQDLSHWILGWRSQFEIFDQMAAEHQDLEELRALSAALVTLADVAEGLAEFTERLAQPYGEYVLPIAHAFRPQT